MLDHREMEKEVEDYIDLYHPNLFPLERLDRVKKCLNLIVEIYNKHSEELTPEEAYQFLFYR